ncbi:MAG: acyclic terpene utilization AtuA family protein, partial [Pseudomonadales bacterium]
RDEQRGYVTDFIEHVQLSLEALKSHFPKIVTNAGGNNPIACAKALQALLSKAGFKKKVIAVTGDNIITKVPELRQVGNTFSNLETGEGFEEMSGRLRTANAYTSSEGIVKALEMGADIVICGRASDSALAIGPIKYEMSWSSDQWDLMASAMVAGHLIECGTQVTGGNYTDWKTIKGWHQMGYPIVEFFE